MLNISLKSTTHSQKDFFASRPSLIPELRAKNLKRQSAIDPLAPWSRCRDTRSLRFVSPASQSQHPDSTPRIHRRCMRHRLLCPSSPARQIPGKTGSSSTGSRPLMPSQSMELSLEVPALVWAIHSSSQCAFNKAQANTSSRFPSAVATVSPRITVIALTLSSLLALSVW